MKKNAGENIRKIPPQKLAFDVDGVFADTFRTFVETARDQYGIQVEYEDITEYDFRQVMDIDEKDWDLIFRSRSKRYENTH